MKKQPGHYCRIRGSRKPKGAFSGKGHQILVTKHALREDYYAQQSIFFQFMFGLSSGFSMNEIIALLQSLPMVPTIEFDKFLFFIDRNYLIGKGIGFVDVNLLASAQLTGVPLWTADKRLKSAADQLELTLK